MKIGWVRLCDIILGKGEQKSGVGWVIGLVGLYVIVLVNVLQEFDKVNNRWGLNR